MTEDTHKDISMDNNARIAALEAQSRDMAKKLDDLHRRLLEKSPTGEPPLAERITTAVIAFERASWMGKFGVWLILGLGSLAAAGTGMLSFLQRIGK